MASEPLLLLVEDEILIAELIEANLNDAGFAVVHAADATAAVAQLEDRPERFAGVITDIKLGGKGDGWDVGRRARELAAGLPIVYVSGDSEAEWTSKGVPNSVLVPKPFAPVQVVTAIASLLNLTTA